MVDKSPLMVKHYTCQTQGEPSSFDKIKVCRDNKGFGALGFYQPI